MFGNSYAVVNRLNQEVRKTTFRVFFDKEHFKDIEIYDKCTLRRNWTSEYFPDRPTYEVRFNSGEDQLIQDISNNIVCRDTGVNYGVVRTYEELSNEVVETKKYYHLQEKVRYFGFLLLRKSFWCDAPTFKILEEKIEKSE